MAERPEALWIVDKARRVTGEAVGGYVFRTRHAARLFWRRMMDRDSPTFRYFAPRRVQFGPEA